MPHQLISAEQLHSLLGSTDSVRVLDVRWRQDRPEGLPEYLQGHIPGAVFVDLDYELSSPGSAPEEGNHPLPRPEDLEEAARRWGIHDGDTVVVYDDMKNLSSARAWWLLRYAGLDDVRILDGSLRAWATAGYPLDSGLELPPPGDVTVEFGHLKIAGIGDITALRRPLGLDTLFPRRASKPSVLIDARPKERYLGADDPLAARPGHIPGALSAPATENIDSQGHLLPPEELRERYLGLGLDPTATAYVYCHSGIHSAHSVLALEHAGFEAVLYPGGYGQWSLDPARPVIAAATLTWPQRPRQTNPSLTTS